MNVTEQISEVPDEEVLEEEQLARLAACCCKLKRCVRATILPDQQWRRGRRWGQGLVTYLLMWSGGLTQ